MSGGDPRVGLVILTRDRRERVRETVARARALPERPAIVVVDNASRDATAAALGREPGLCIVRNHRNRGAAGRNDGARRVRAPYVAFSDDDAWWAPGALARAADHLDRHPHTAVVTARVLVGEAEREDPTCAAMAASPLAAGGADGVPVVGFLAGACVMRRAAFEQARGYEPRLFLGAEESLLALDLLAAGWSLVYLRDVVAHHHPSPQRDAPGRRALLRRNALWVALLRRPWRVVRLALADALAEAAAERATAQLLLSTLRHLPWLLARRRPVPASVERMVRAVEGDTDGRQDRGAGAVAARSA